MQVILESSWMSHILRYLLEDELPPDEEEARNVQKQTAKYIILLGKLSKMGESIPNVVMSGRA